MASRIEQTIEQIKDYIDSCKGQMFNSSNIVVNRDELDALLDELEANTPIEIKNYQRVISNKEEILADAQKKADLIVQKAQIKTNELLSEHQIMQQAYAQANEIVMLSRKQAEETINRATVEANELRASAVQYTDDLMKNIEETLVHAIDTTKARNDALLQSLQGYLDVVVTNRTQLNPVEQMETVDSGTSQPTESAPDVKTDLLGS